jgi:hypothetical protein
MDKKLGQSETRYGIYSLKQNNQVKICDKNSKQRVLFFENRNDVLFGKNKKGIYYYSNTNAFTKI